MDGGDVGKPAAGGYHGKGRIGPSAEEEQTCMVARGLLPFLFLTVERIEHVVTAVYIVDHAIERADHRRRIHVAVIRQERANIAQAHGFVIATAVPRQEQASEAGEGGVVEEVAHAVIGVQVSALVYDGRPFPHLIAPAVGGNHTPPVRHGERRRPQEREYQASS